MNFIYSLKLLGQIVDMEKKPILGPYEYSLKLIWLKNSLRILVVELKIKSSKNGVSWVMIEAGDAAFDMVIFYSPEPNFFLLEYILFF